MELLKCPQCGGWITIEDDDVDQRAYYCEFCGARAVRPVQSDTAVNARTRVKEFEHEEVMADKAHDHEINVMETEYAQEAEKDKRDYGMLLIALGILIAIPIVLSASLFLGHVGKIQVAKSAAQMRGVDHVIVENELRSLGFKDIESQALGDKGGLFDFAQEGAVAYISIGGDSSFGEDEWFPKDSVVIITYHSTPDY